jgi:hypothetical protein
MYRGLSFKIPNQYGKCLLDILQPVDCNKYNWVIDSDQSWMKNVNKKVCVELFFKKRLTGEEFFRIISKEDYYIVSARIGGYSNSKIKKKIKTYLDFMHSECEIFILLVDSVYVEIYCKNLPLVESLYSNAKKKKFENLEYIDENNTRATMEI